MLVDATSLTYQQVSEETNPDLNLEQLFTNRSSDIYGDKYS